MFIKTSKLALNVSQGKLKPGMVLAISPLVTTVHWKHEASSPTYHDVLVWSIEFVNSEDLYTQPKL